MQGDVDDAGADDGHNAGSVGANITRMRVDMEGRRCRFRYGADDGHNVGSVGANNVKW